MEDGEYHARRRSSRTSMLPSGAYGTDAECRTATSASDFLAGEEPGYGRCHQSAGTIQSQFHTSIRWSASVSSSKPAGLSTPCWPCRAMSPKLSKWTRMVQGLIDLWGPAGLLRDEASRTMVLKPNIGVNCAADCRGISDAALSSSLHVSFNRPADRPHSTTKAEPCRRRPPCRPDTE